MDVPTTLDTGARRLPVVFARVGVLPYPWGNERVDAAVLGDKAFHDALTGLPVVVGIDDVAHPDRVMVGDEGAKAGVILSVRFDADQGALVGEVVIDTLDGLAAIRRGVRGVSLGYKADCTPTAPDDRADGATHRRTVMYAPNHLILTLSPRGGPSVAVRADGGDPMEMPDLQKFIERLDAYAARLDAMGDMSALMGRMDALEAKVGPALEKWAAQEAKEPEHRGDSAADWRGILAVAADRKIEIPDGADLLTARRTVAAAVVGKRADSLDAAALDAVIAASAAAPRADSFAAWEASFRTAPPAAGRQDAASSDPLAGA